MPRLVRTVRVGFKNQNEIRQSVNEKNRRVIDLPVFLLGAGVGFEPHDLQVMSLTSYRTAPSRDRITNVI